MFGIKLHRPGYQPLSPQSSQSSRSTDRSSDIPTLASFKTSHEYAAALEKRFGGDMSKLWNHIKTQSEEEQTALIDNIKMFRDFLGIRNPERKSQKYLLGAFSSSSNPIYAKDAPAALVMAATRSGDQGRVMRSLDKLSESVKTLLKDAAKAGRRKNQIESMAYQDSIKSALAQLALEMGEGKLKEPAAIERAVKIIYEHKAYLGVLTPPEGYAKHPLVSFADQIKDNPEISGEIHALLGKLCEENLQTPTAHRAAELARRENERAKVRIEHATTRVQGQTNNRPNQHGSPRLSRNPSQEQAKALGIKVDKIKTLNPEFFNYAEMVVTDTPKEQFLQAEKEHLSLIADMENEKNPGLNLRVFDDPKTCHKKIANMQRDIYTDFNARFVYPPYKNQGDEMTYFALDIKIQPGKPISITVHDDVMPPAMNDEQREERNQLKKDLLSELQNSSPRLKDAKIKFETDNQSAINRIPSHMPLGRLTHAGDSMMASLDRALKIFEDNNKSGDTLNYMGFKIPTVDRFRLTKIKDVQDYLIGKKSKNQA